jgi:hypothetical protein
MILKRVFFAGLVALFGCGMAGAQPNLSSEASPNSSYVPSKEWMQLQSAYATQQEKLQRDLGSGVFVASYKGVIYDGQMATFSIWTDTAVTALPKAEFVWLQDAKMTRWFVVPWSDLEAAIGKLPALERVDPPRYLTPANIPAPYFSSLEKTYVPPKGFPERLATGHR